MRFAIYSVYGCDLPFAARLQDEGHEVLMYVDKKNPMERGVGENLVPRTNNLLEWKAWGNDKQTVFIFGGSGCGAIADGIRRTGRLVVGAGSFCDKLEEKRAWAEGLANSIGITVPPHKEFPDIPAARNYARGMDNGEWVFKSDKFLKSSATYLASSADEMVRYLDGLEKEFGNGGRCLLQHKIPGVAISTAAWWNGKTFLGPFEGTIEHKKFLNDDLGPNTGCSFNVVWMYQDLPNIARALQWRALDSYFRAKAAPPGLYDINALIGDDGVCYFLEFTPRFGYDSEPTAQRLLTMELGEFYYKLATGQLEEVPFSRSHLAYAIRLSVPPYPAEDNVVTSGKGSSVGVPIIDADGIWDRHFIGYGVRENKKGELEVSSPYGLVGLALAVGTTVQGVHDKVLKYLKDELQIPNLQYRTDGVQRIEDDLKALAKTDFKVKEVQI